MRQFPVYTIILLFTGLSFLVSCKGKVAAEITDTYKTGIIKEERYYDDEKTKDAYTRITYYENGDTSEVSHYRNAMKNGYEIGYTHSGLVNHRLHFINDFKVDTIFDYTDSGVISQMQIIGGKCPDTLCCCDGVHLEFENGKLRERFDMKDKNSDGIHETFYPSSKIHEKYDMVNCDIHGSYGAWYENGKLKAEGKYQFNKKEGQWRYWESDGSGYIINYREGNRSGQAIEYYGDTSEVKVGKGMYENDKEAGRWYFFDKDSSLLYECDYVNDLRTGKYIGYHKNGRIRVTGNEINDKWEGIVKRYDTIGKLTQIELYKNGEKR